MSLATNLRRVNKLMALFGELDQHHRNARRSLERGDDDGVLQDIVHIRDVGVRLGEVYTLPELDQ